MEENKDTLLGKFIKTLSYKEQAYDLIKDAILFNKFRIGAIYSQESICNELGISRTPVREALIELQKEGYITILRGRGIEVTPVTEEDAKDILEVRIFYEKNNAFLAAKREFEEEVGYKANKLEKICTYYNSAGVNAGQYHLFCRRNASKILLHDYLCG